MLFLLMMSWHGSLYCVTLSGVVLDESENLRDVEVMLVNAQSSVVLQRFYTDDAGRFSFTVGAGAYHVGAFKHDYTITWQKDIVVEDADVAVRIEMEPQAFTDEAVSDDCE